MRLDEERTAAALLDHVQGPEYIREVVEDAHKQYDIELTEVLVRKLIDVHLVIFNLDRIELLHDIVAMVLLAPIVDGDYLCAASSELQGEKPV